MNNIQLKVKLASLNTEYVGQDAKIVVSGMAKYQFYNNGKMNTRTMAYRAFGQAALSLQNAGKESVHVISGQLNVYPPNDQNPNHSMLLTINHCLPVAVNQAPVQSQPVAKPQPQPMPQPQPVAQPNPVESTDQIPF